MSIMAAVCGIVIVILGLLSTLSSSNGAPTDGEFAIQVTCLVGGLILCFLAAVLSRLATLIRRLDEFEARAEDSTTSADSEERGRDAAATMG